MKVMKFILPVIVKNFFSNSKTRKINIQYSVSRGCINNIESLEGIHRSEIINEIIIPSSYTDKYGITYKIHCLDFKLNKSNFGNSYIEKIYIEDGIEKIEDSAFMNCNGIKNIRWPLTCKNIPVGCFQGCRTLSFIENIEKIESIGELAFCQMGFKSFIWPEKCNVIPDYCFSECDTLEDITINNKIQNIGMYAFSGTKLKSFVWPDDCKVIPAGCFRYCENLSTIQVNKMLTSIEPYAFEKTSLSFFDANNLVIQISNNAFPYDCVIKKSIYQ